MQPLSRRRRDTLRVLVPLVALASGASGSPRVEPATRVEPTTLAESADRIACAEGVWSETILTVPPEILQFGVRVAASDDGAVIVGGTVLDEAWVFERGASGWAAPARLDAGPANAPTDFGEGAVDLSGDGTVAVFGDRRSDEFTGAVFVLERRRSGWSLAQRLRGSDAAPDDELGYAAAVSADGSTIVAGTFGSGLGPNAAYVFVRDGERWVERQKLVPWDGDLGGRFGARVAVSPDGGVVAVGASLNGAIYVFERDGDAWAGRRRFDTGTRVAGLAAASGVVAATDVVTGLAFVYRRTGTGWASDAELPIEDGSPRRFDHPVALSADGRALAIGAHGGSGAEPNRVVLFRERGGAWSVERRFEPAFDDRFGRSVDLGRNGTAVVAGGFARFDDRTTSGAVYVYRERCAGSAAAAPWPQSCVSTTLRSRPAVDGDSAGGESVDRRKREEPDP